MLRRILLGCGVVASLLYVGIDVLAAIRYPDYHSFFSRAISELMASGAPTERLVDPPLLFYDVLMMAFAVGVWRSSPRRRVHVAAGLLFAYAAVGLLGPTLGEMNVRGSGGPASADIFHIALTGVLSVFIFASVLVAAGLRGRTFRRYSFATVAIMLGFGVLTAFAMGGIDRGAPTPWVGFLERIDVGAFLAWVAVLSIALLRDAAAERTPMLHGERMPPSALPAR